MSETTQSLRRSVDGGFVDPLITAPSSRCPTEDGSEGPLLPPDFVRSKAGYRQKAPVQRRRRSPSLTRQPSAAEESASRCRPPTGSPPRTEQRRGGKKWYRQGTFRWWPYH